MRVVFTCGGTAGHINPAIAVARTILERQPSSDILFIGAEGGMEEKLVPREGFTIKTVHIASVRRGITPAAIAHNAAMLYHRRRSVTLARGILEEFKPDVVVGMGGFASYPAVTAAQQLGIPTAIHQSDIKPGLTTSVLARRADRIMVGFEQGRRYYRDPARVVVTGTPVRDDFIFKSKEQAKRELGLDDKPLIVSFWGSLGAREMNKYMAGFIKLECENNDGWHHIHSTGSFGWKWMPDLVRDMGVDLARYPQIDMREYIYNMPDVMCAADLIICRAGAETLSEVVASATPAIIIPSPNVTGNHQEPNARALEEMGGAVVLLEQELSAERLYSEAKRLLSNPVELTGMSKNFKSVSVLDAASRIYDTIRQLSHK